jgi:hypothetical protein
MECDGVSGSGELASRLAWRPEDLGEVRRGCRSAADGYQLGRPGFTVTRQSVDLGVEKKLIMSVLMLIYSGFDSVGALEQRQGKESGEVLSDGLIPTC